MKLCLVCSHGGHTTELLELSAAWAGHDLFFITYPSQRTLPGRTYTFGNLTERPLRLLPMLPRVLGILARERPDWVISNGAEIAIPVFLAAKLLRRRTMFIESYCRVRSASFTGRIVYPLSDVFFVQWEGLLSRFGSKARYAGAVV